MIQDPEDDRLDQSLRDTFSDFDLPPTSRVWKGIEGRLAAQPVPPRPMPLKLLLPIVGLVGVGVGWLLPRPTDKPAAQPAPTVQAYPQPAPKAMDAAMAYVAPQPAASSQQIQSLPAPAISRLVSVASAKSSKRPVVLLQPVAPETVPVEAIASLEPTTATLPAHSIITLSAAELAAYLATGTQATLPAVASGDPQLLNTVGIAAASEQTQHATELLRHTSKGENLGEWRPEYRMSKHRTAERGLKLRRFRNHISKQWQQWFAPRRTRSTQPAS